MKAATKKKAEAKAQTAAETAGKSRARSKKALIKKVIHEIEDRLGSDQIKPTVGDLIRLVQLEKELEKEAEQPREIKVTWVEPGEKESA